MGLEAKRQKALKRAEQDLGNHGNHTYAPLRQGPWSPFDVRFAEMYHRQAAEGASSLDISWFTSLAHSPHLLLEYKAHRREYKAAMGDIRQLLGVMNPSEISGIFRDGLSLEDMAKVDRKLTRLYRREEPGTKIKERRRAKTISDYGIDANKYIDWLRFGILNPIAWKIRPSEEVVARNHPIGLAELVYRPANRKLTFEALRKMFHMTKMAAIDFRFSEQDETQDYGRVIDSMDARGFWSGERGETTPVVFLSVHSPEDYSVMTPEALGVINPDLLPITEISADDFSEVAERVKRQNPEQQGYYLRLTTLQSRSFVHRGRVVRAFLDPRIKTLESRANKMQRKNEEDPSVAVEDKLGMMVVVKDERDVDAFLDHLIDMGVRSGIFLRIEGLEDSLGGKTFSARNLGSSQRTEMLKGYIRTLGLRIEDIVVPVRDYLHYKWHDEIGHSELEVRRLFDTGLFEILFPSEIYPDVNPEEDREYLLQVIHDAKRNPRESVG